MHVHFRHVLIIVICAIAAFASSLLNGFALDDIIHIVRNPAIRDLSSAGALFQSAIYPGDLFRPLTMFSYAVTYAAVGLDPFVYHLTNIMLHMGVAAIAYAFCNALNLPHVALPVALLFAVHPIHIETVANVSGRAEILTALFLISGLLVLLRSRSKASAGWAGILFMFSLLSKESACALIILAPLTLAMSQLPNAQRRAGLLLSFVAVMFFVVWRASIVSFWPDAPDASLFLDNPLVEMSTIERLPIAVALLGRYFAMILFPYPLSADYSYAVIDPVVFWRDPGNSLYAVLAALTAVMTLALHRRDKAGFFFGAWFFASFLVTSNVLFPIGTIFAERLCYLPSLGGIGLVVSLARMWLPALSQKLMLALFTISGLLLCFFHSKNWKDNTTLHSYQMTVSPESAKTLANYAMVLRNKGELENADILLRDALRIYPKFANAAFGLGSVYGLKGLNSGAEHWFHKALEIQPGHVPSLTALGRLYLKEGKVEQAAGLFNQALAKEPDSFEARIGKAALLIVENRRHEAKKLLLELRREDPYNRELIALLNKVSD